MGRRRNSATPHRLPTVRAVVPVDRETAFRCLADPDVRERRYRSAIEQDQGSILQWSVRDGLVYAVSEQPGEDEFVRVTVTEDLQVVSPQFLRRNVTHGLRLADGAVVE